MTRHDMTKSVNKGLMRHLADVDFGHPAAPEIIAALRSAEARHGTGAMVAVAITALVACHRQAGELALICDVLVAAAAKALADDDPVGLPAGRA
jgi:hypothetical protein